jgi:hypothetical protein
MPTKVASSVVVRLLTSASSTTARVGPTGICQGE